MKELVISKTSFILLFLWVFFAGCSTERDENDDLLRANSLSLGVSAKDLLSDEKYTSLKVEMAYVEGFEPAPTTIAQIKNFLETYTHKPKGITVVTRPVASPGGGPYEISEIADIEKDSRTIYTSGKEIAVFILFADGKSAAEEDKNLILGTAYRNTSMVIFQQTVKELSRTTGIVRSEIESTTIKHEFGHLFGLVNNGSPAQSAHEDTESKSHCNVDNCLMVAKVEFGSGTLDLLKTQQTLEFDESCLLDLRANGGR